MASRRYSLQGAPIAVGAGVTKTVLLLTGAEPTAEIHEVSVSFDGVLSTAQKARVQLLRFTTGGTMTPLTPVKLDPPIGDAAASGFHTATVEPTADDVLFDEYIHLQAGYTWRISGLGIRLGNGEYIGIRIINGTTAVNCLPRIIFEE